MNQYKKSTGVIPEIAPTRDYDYEVACGAINDKKTYPKEFEINDRYLGFLKDQEYFNCCVGCVMSSLAEIFELIEQYGDLETIPKEEWEKIISDRDSVEFSEFWAYGALRTDYDGEGMFVSDAVKNWSEKGILPSKFFNLREEVPDILEEVKKFPNLYEVAKNYKTKSYVSLNYALEEKKDLAIKEALTKYKHGLLGVSDKYFGGSHCIMVVGWNDNTNKYKIKNSWGNDWGDEHGVGEIPKHKLNDVYLVLDKELQIPFKDVQKTDWFYKAVKNMFFANLMKGVDDIHFEPTRNITRAEMAALIHRIVIMVEERINLLIKVAKEKGALSRDFEISSLLVENRDLPFTDIDSKAWYYNDIKAIYSLSLIKGVSDTLFAPEDNLTRAELATLCVRLYSLIVNRFNDVLKNSNGKKLKNDNINNIKEFADVSKDSWYYDYVKTCCGLELMNGTGDNVFEPEEKTTRAEVATILNRLMKYIDKKSNETRSLL